MRSAGGVCIAFFNFSLARRKDCEERLKNSSRARREASERLASEGWSARGRRYRQSLGSALAWLDRVFGEPGSADALGLCILIAVAYAYASFFLGWSLGASGGIADVKFLPQLDAFRRWIWTVIAVAAPPAAYYGAGWLARRIDAGERRLKARLLRRWRRHIGRRRFGFAYRGITGLAAFAVVATPLWALSEDTESLAIAAIAAIVAFSLAFATVPLWGALAGRTVAGFRFNRAAMGIAAFALGAVAVAVSIAASIGALSAMARPVERRRRGIGAGALGGWVGFGLIAALFDDKYMANEFALFSLLFFFVLPLANGVFDWLSWWATRALGRNLARWLDAGAGGRRWLAIAAHGLADLAIAAALLLLMAFALALGFGLYNEIARAQGAEVFHLRGVIQAAADKPASEGFWFGAMLLTTLLPTFGHAAILLGAPLGLWIPGGTRARLIQALNRYEGESEEEKGDIRHDIARWLVYGQWANRAASLLLLLWLLGCIPAALYGFYEGGGAVAGRAALSGVDAAEWLGDKLK